MKSAIAGHARIRSLFSRHGIENTNGARRGNKGAGAATVFSRDLGTTCLTYVVKKLDCAIRSAGNPTEGFRYGINRHVVIFAYPMSSDERIQDHDVESSGNERIGQGCFDRLGDGGTVLSLCSDDDFNVAAGIDEQVPLDFGRIDSEAQAGRLDPALDFIDRVFAVPVPDTQLLSGRDAEQIFTGRHRDALYDGKRSLADPAWSNGRA
jgi:hypothetical protein